MKTSHVELACKKCEFKTISADGLSKHIEEHHPSIDDQDVFKCTECNETFVSKVDGHLLKHKEIHEEIRYQCEQCDFQTIVKTELESHTKVHETVTNQVTDPTVPDPDMLSENVTLKRQVQAIKNSYERLTSMYKSMKEETNSLVTDAKR